MDTEFNGAGQYGELNLCTKGFEPYGGYTQKNMLSRDKNQCMIIVGIVKKCLVCFRRKKKA